MMILRGHGFSSSVAATPTVHTAAKSKRPLTWRRWAQKIWRNRVRFPRRMARACSPAGHSLRQTWIVVGATPVGIEDRGARRGEVRQLARLAQGEPTQLGQQIAEV